MLLVGLIISALLLLAALVLVLLRARRYVEAHPELVETGVPVSYVRCQRTLSAVISRFRQLHGAALSDMIAWQSPGGYRYIVDREAIDQRRGDAHRYRLRWSEIGGVGVRMQPGFRFADRDYDGSTDRRYITGYAFYLLVVPLTGRTLSIQIPTDGSEDAIAFAAWVLALADRQRKRINVFGFDKPPGARRQRMRRY